MFFKAFSFLAGCVVLHLTAFTQIPVGTWREHLPYMQAVQVVAASNKVFCATPYSLFSVDLVENSISRLSKINGLHETGISAIGVDTQTNKLVIAYANSNIDVLYKNDIINIDAVKRKVITADKNIYNIHCFGGKAYLSTGLGVVVVDENKYEVKDTYVLGSTGNYDKVNGFCTDGRFFYAACDEGLKRSDVNAANLADYHNWQLLSGSGGLPAGAAQQVVSMQGRIIVQHSDSLFALNGSTWSLWHAGGQPVVSISFSAGKLVLCQQEPGSGSVIILNADGSVSGTIRRAVTVVNPRQALLVQQDVWIADSTSGLLRFNGNGFQPFQPNAPSSIATGDMVFHNNSLYVASGSVTPGLNNTSTKNGFYQFSGNEWTNYNGATLPAADSLYDLVTIAVHPADNSIWAGSFGGGLLQLKPDRSVTVFKQHSAISPALADPASYRVAGLAFDADNNLWISNYGAAQNVVVRKADGSWRAFTIPFSHNDNAVTQIIVDDHNQKWIVSPNGNGLFCFNHGSSIDNTGDDRWLFYRAGKGNGNLPDNTVLCIAKDRNGFIWVGTAKGIGIIECPQQASSVQGCEAVLPVVQQDNFAGYLFADEQVQAIAVDGADRKWIGTKNGVWLISADGAKTIYHFREENSLLLDNDVKKIAVDPATGEVFFATAKGICSYRGTATEGGTTNENVLVFPNPVPPGFNGTVAIRGLVNNAIVKITELDGRLVYQVRASGGQANWNGRNYKGNKISTGVYLVLVSDETGNEKIATKIVFIQ